jgi:hypothetical protein
MTYSMCWPQQSFHIEMTWNLKNEWQSNNPAISCLSRGNARATSPAGMKDISSNHPYGSPAMGFLMQGAPGAGKRGLML